MRPVHASSVSLPHNAGAPSASSSAGAQVPTLLTPTPQLSFLPLHCQCCSSYLTIQSDLIISHLISKQNKTETFSSPSITPATHRWKLSHFLDLLRRVVSLPHACSPHNTIQPPLCCLCCYQEKTSNHLRVDKPRGMLFFFISLD